MLPSIFSFLLPGLGQLYQRRTLEAVVFFGGFILVLYTDSLRVLVPLVVVGASAESLFSRRARQVKAKEIPNAKRRNGLFTVVGLVGFIAWISLIPYTFLPIGKRIQMQEHADTLSSVLRDCKKTLGQSPDTIEVCNSGQPSLDIWGTPFRYAYTAEGFSIVSSGRDREPNTGDDITFTYTW